MLTLQSQHQIFADMAELADAHGSGPCESNFMQVQVLLPAPISSIHKGFGFLNTRFLFFILRLNVNNWGNHKKQNNDNYKRQRIKLSLDLL